MKKTSELEGVELDYAAAEALGCKFPNYSVKYLDDMLHLDITGPFFLRDNKKVPWRPSIDYSDGMKLLDFYLVSTSPCGGNANGAWEAHIDERKNSQQYGKTRLMAGVRCVVAEKLGKSVDVPRIFNTGTYDV